MSATQIDFVHARRVWNSRGRPTVEAEVRLRGGATGRAIAPSGLSVGPYEARERRDGGDRFGGWDVAQTVAGMRGELSDALLGVEALDQKAVDAVAVATDGSPHRGRLGANALVAISLASARAAAVQLGRPLWQVLAEAVAAPAAMPRPRVDVFGGGLHAARRCDLQSVGVVLLPEIGLSEALMRTAAVVQAAADMQQEAGTPAGRCDGGGLWPTVERNEDLLIRTVQAIERAGFRPGHDMAMAVDIAAGMVGRNGRYRLARDGRRLETGGMVDLLTDWARRYPIAVLEDPLSDDDPDGLIELTRRLGDRLTIVADDFVCGDAGRILSAARIGACNAASLKPNQSGTITDTRAAAQACGDSGWRTSYGVRGADSEDVAIVHLAVAWGGDELALGGLFGGEHAAKWNEAIRIEEQLIRRL